MRLLFWHIQNAMCQEVSPSKNTEVSRLPTSVTVDVRLALEPDQKEYAVGHDFSYTQVLPFIISAICLVLALSDTQASTSLKMALSLGMVDCSPFLRDYHYFHSEFISTHC